MAQRPFENQNWQGRNFQSFGPKFRIDISNPQMGLNGSDVYNLYATTDNKDISLVGMSEGGIFHIYNDQSIEIIAGQKSKSTGVDIVITGKNGDIWITAEKNGQVRIRGSKITIDADESINLVAGKNINLTAGNSIKLKSNIAECDGLEGNLAPVPKTFGGITFDGTYVGADIISTKFGGGLV
jgi:hypothetical protein